MKLATYIQFDGNCEQAYERYAKIFSAKKILLWRIDDKDCPSEKLLGKVMHAELQIGSFYLYMCDLDKPLDPLTQNLHLTFEADSLKQAQDIFDGLKLNGTIKRPLSATPWGSLMGHVFDEFGIEWDVLFEEAL